MSESTTTGIPPRVRSWTLRPVAALLLWIGLSLPATSHAEGATGDAEGRTTWVPFPFLFYTPETGTGGGGMVLVFFGGESDSARSSSVAPILVLTEKKQYSLTLVASLYRDEGRTRLSGAVSFAEFPSTLWEIGSRSSKATEEDYTPRTFLLEAGVQREFLPGWFAGPGIRFAHRRLVEIVSGGLLDRHRVPGAADGQILGAGGSVSHDTRDYDTSPTRGDLWQLGTLLFDPALGSDYSFTETVLDLRHFHTLRPGAVLALRGRSQAAVGHAPFDVLPALGGESLLRGYYQGRYRDRVLVAAQAELRLHFWRRLGGVLFADTGEVASAFESLRWEHVRVSAGCGLRILLSRDEQFHLRADFGAGGNDSGFYVGLGEVF